MRMQSFPKRPSRQAVYWGILGLLAISVQSKILAKRSTVVGANVNLLKINSRYMISPTQARDWAYQKSLLGPTYAGSIGWQKYASFLEATAVSLGLVDLHHVDIP